MIRERHPEHFAYVATRASTGMRACHVSALQWADIDEAAGVITGHVTEQMREHYSTVGLDEKRAAVAAVLRLLPQGESADNGADAGTPANDTVEAEAAKAAK